MTVGQGSFTAVVFHKDRDGSLQVSSLCPDFTAKERKAQRREVLCPKPHSYRVAEFKPESRILPSQLRLCLSTSRKPPNNSLFLKIYLCLAALGLCCWVQAFSSSGEQGLVDSCSVSASHCTGFSCWRARAFGSCPGFSRASCTGFSSCNTQPH